MKAAHSKVNPMTPLQAMAHQLARDYGVSPVVTTLTSLAALSAALGKSCRIEPYPGSSPIPTTLNLALVTNNHPFMGEMVMEAFGPLLELQREGLERQDAKWLKKEESRLTAARQSYLASSDYPDPGHLQFFDEPLMELRHSRQPFFLLDPSPDEIHDALNESHDESLAALVVKPEKVAAIIQEWDSKDGERERALVARGWRGQSTVHRHQGRVEMELVQPCLSVALAGRKQDIHRLITLPNLVASGVAGTFLMARVDGSSSEGALTLTSEHDAHRGWQDLLAAAFHRKRSREILTLRLSSRARRIFDCFRDKVWNRDMADGQRLLAAAWPEQTLRVAGLLHLSTGTSVAVIGRESVIAAVRLAMDCIRQQTALLQVAAEPGPVERFVEHCVVPNPDAELTVADAFNSFTAFCRTNGLPVPLRKDFTPRFTAILRVQLHRCQRGDIPGLNGKAQNGWRGVSICIPESETEPASQPATRPELPVSPEPPQFYDL